MLGHDLAAKLLGKAQAASSCALQVEEKLSLGPKKMVYLVRCREKEFLIAAANDASMVIIEVSPGKPDQIVEPAGTSIIQAQKSERAS